jgi:hypothetical protein
MFPAILGPGTRLINAPEVMLELFAGADRSATGATSRP